MTLETQKILYLTREEKRLFEQFYDILNDDNNLDVFDVWEIFTAIYDNDNSRAEYYNYQIKITD